MELDGDEPTPEARKSVSQIETDSKIAKLQEQMADMQRTITVSTEDMQRTITANKEVGETLQQKICAVEGACMAMDGRLGGLEAASTNAATVFTKLAGAFEPLEARTTASQAKAEDAFAAILARLEGDEAPRKKQLTQQASR